MAPTMMTPKMTLTKIGGKACGVGKAAGAGCRIRTRGPLITNQVLYQLS